MNQKEINEIVNEHYGFTIEEIDEDLGKALLRVKQLEYNNEKLRQENNQLKDRELIINMELVKLQEENKQLKENNQAMQEEMARTWKKLDVIKKIKSWLLEILDDKNDIFSVVRVRDVLIRLNKLENKGEEIEKNI